MALYKNNRDKEVDVLITNSTKIWSEKDGVLLVFIDPHGDSDILQKEIIKQFKNKSSGN